MSRVLGTSCGRLTSIASIALVPTFLLASSPPLASASFNLCAVTPVFEYQLKFSPFHESPHLSSLSGLYIHKLNETRCRSSAEQSASSWRSCQ